MSYDFKGADGGVFSAYPNPYKIENVFLLLGAFAFLASGAVCIFDARAYMLLNEMKAGTASSMLGVLLLGLGAKLLIRGLSQLRFWMGQHYPFGLAGTTDHMHQYGECAQDLTETLRQQTIRFPEPQGPLNGLLYTFIKRLIVAPPVLQEAAQKHFAALVHASVLLVSMAISMLMFAGHPNEGLMSWFYLPLSGLSLYQLIRRHSAPAPKSGAVITRGVAVLVFAAFAPAFLPQMAQHIPIVLAPMWSASLAVQLGTLCASGMFLLAVSTQIDAAERTGVACDMQIMDMNCMPAQLWTEIDREFQRNWTNEIPNRQYINALPTTSSGERGGFRGEILEETQPIPKDRMVFASFAEAFKTRHGQVLISMSLFGLFLVILGSAFAVLFSARFAEFELHQIWSAILLVVATSSTATASVADGHLLWSRIHFKSKITWIEVSGTYQRASIDVGNTFRGNIKSSSTITRIEDATIRVWSAELESVVFGKDGARSVISMTPMFSEAKRLVDHLQNFAARQSTVAAPTRSSRDLEKLSTVASLGQAMGSHANNHKFGENLLSPIPSRGYPRD